MSGWWILPGLIAVLVLGGILLYNNLVSKRNMVKEGWSGIEAQLKRRANLIPNLVSTVEGYAGHERKALKELTAMRTEALRTHDVDARGQAEGLLGRAIGGLFAVAENYPDLKASQNFLDLQQTLAEIEDQIQKARRYYNGTVRNLNTMIESFPSNLVARYFGFEAAQFFVIEDRAESSVPKVSFDALG